MRPQLEPTLVLRRVLELERQQGFLDRAAMGGLQRFVCRQIEGADKEHVGPLLAASMALQEYSRVNRAARESAVNAALHALDSARERTTGEITRPEPVAPPAEEEHLPPVALEPSHRQSSTRPVPRAKHHAEELDVALADLKQVRKPMHEPLSRIGVLTVRDLLYYFPRTHYDYTDTTSISRMHLGEKITLVGTIKDVRVNRTARNVAITTATIADDTGTVAVRWFNQPYLVKNLPVGQRIAISGEPDVFNGRYTFTPRDYELIDQSTQTHTARLVPMYPLTKGLYQRSLRQLIYRIVQEYAGTVEDFLPQHIRRDLRLPDLASAIFDFHFPDDDRARNLAQRRLAFDELFLIQIGLHMRKNDWQKHDETVAVPVNHALLDRFSQSLPFSLTGAQRRVIGEVVADLGESRPMSRLLQGDVGSGKTVVAAAGLLQVAAAGRQGVLMAPTEILAEQHFRTISDLLAPFEMRCEMLVGSTPRSLRKAIYACAADGSLRILIGTHALIEGEVQFANLGLAVTDEQHRFGVEQRATLRRKGAHPHTLAMTATPIPRTLALTIYGDLDVSSLDEMPPGRHPVITTWCRTPTEAYGVVRSEVLAGHQAFVICPVIEETADRDMRSVLAEHKELGSMVFPDLSVGLLHGRMKSSDKERALGAFRAGDLQVLVATSVVEVGIDVPNATVMVIRDAHRFGLAQLHQFRGRVGRGAEQAYCILLSATEGDQARERLEALTATQNGFELAETDLRLRGPGEFWGLRQSGLPALHVAKLGDVETIEAARGAARRLLSSDPELSLPESAELRRQLNRFWRETVDFS